MSDKKLENASLEQVDDDKDRVIVYVDASAFTKRAADAVREGEVLGSMHNRPVVAPFDGYVRGVSFDPEEHVLAALLARGVAPPVHTEKEPVQKKSVLRVDASVFTKREGDAVLEGELLGYLDGEPVRAPFDGRVQGASFDAEEHDLVVLIARDETPQSKDESPRSSDPHE